VQSTIEEMAGGFQRIENLL